MTKVRWAVNGLSAAVICAGALVLSPARSNATAAAGGTCCDQNGATCYLDVGGRLIIQSNAYASDGPCKPVVATPEVAAVATAK